jgi:hypothetical protein
MAWPSKNHLDNLEEILTRLHWLIQPDTVLTELPYDLEFISMTDVERFADWCRSSVSKTELESGTYRINKALIKFFVDQSFPDLDKEQKKEKIDFLFEMLHRMLKIPDFEAIPLDKETVNKIIDVMDEIPGEGHFDKTVKKIKVGVSLKWLQDREILDELSDKTKKFILRLGDFYGKAKKGEHIYVKDIGTHNPPEEDKAKIIDDFNRKVDLALMEASQDINSVKIKYKKDSDYGQFGKIIDTIKRIELYVDGKHDNEYDYIEQFKDTVFIVIILNYIQDPYIKRSKEAANLLKLTLPIYTKYKELEKT